MADYKSTAKKKIKRKVKNKIRKSPIIIAIILILALVLAGLYFFGDKIGIDIFGKEDTAPTVSTPKGEAYFHFIDVGQADAILITTNEGNMLIDSGDLSIESRKSLTDYLAAQGVTGFKYAVFTHTDSDHIGSADYIVNNYDVENVIMPDYTATTKVYERLITAIEEKNVNLILIGEDKEVCKQSGYMFMLGSMVNTVMAPTEDFDDPNEMSVVIKSSFGSVDVLLTGDAEHKSEAAMLEIYKKNELDCEILKVGHHGSSSSTTEEFLANVSPDIAIISCGEGNKYGHPHKVTMDRLEEAGIPIYRTDKLGTIVIKTNGTTYEIVE